MEKRDLGLKNWALLNQNRGFYTQNSIATDNWGLVPQKWVFLHQNDDI